MSFNAIEQFDYANGADIYGSSGGSGWAGAWAGENVFKATTSVKIEGTASAYITNPTGGGNSTRVLSIGASTGIMKASIRQTSASVQGIQIGFLTDSTFCGIVRVVSGNVQLFDNLTLTNIEDSTFAANTWYDLYIEYDCATDKYRARLDALPVGTWYNFFNGGTATTINGASIGFGSTATYTGYIDNLTGAYIPLSPSTAYRVRAYATNSVGTSYGSTVDVTTTSGTSIKSINGLARASVKSVNGLAIASVKSWNGLA